MGKNSSLLDALPSTQGTLHVVMLGLDSAGKTTALYRLKFDQYLNTVPTIGFNCEKVRCQSGKAKGINFLVWDVGGQEKLRPLWKSYTRCTDGIVFVLDSVDVERMEEAKMELGWAAGHALGAGLWTRPTRRSPRSTTRAAAVHLHAPGLGPQLALGSATSQDYNELRARRGRQLIAMHFNGRLSWETVRRVGCPATARPRASVGSCCTRPGWGSSQGQPLWE
ncbi:hypothetical protein FOCC_FOCC014560 [Frankliniella occidentalis]|nr:hypothetical protein FOCC_FOCC014560 [Frankliniella occidentalis]